jgi:hypothetical protein
MARRDGQAKLRQQKDARQKKVLFLLLPLFLGLVAWQGPKTYKALFAAPEAAPVPVAAAPTATSPADPSAPTPATAQPAAGLSDTELPLPGGPDRLVSFSRFVAKDPFAGSGSGTPDAAATTAPGDEQATSAVFDVNGTSETVAVGGQFPSSDPTFRLVSVSGTGAVVGLVSGSFEGGASTVDLAVGEELELVADPDGTRYVVALVSVG